MRYKRGFMWLAALLVAVAAGAYATGAGDEAVAEGDGGWEKYVGGCPAACAALKERGFVVTDETDEMMDFYVYTRGYITTDALLYAYFVTLERSYAELERGRGREPAPPPQGALPKNQ